MGIKFISGTDNFGVPVSEKSESPNDGYYIANVMLVNDYLSFSRLPGAKQQIEDEPTPILGLGLHKAFMSAAKEWEAIKNHRIKIRSEISTLTEL